MVFSIYNNYDVANNRIPNGNTLKDIICSHDNTGQIPSDYTEISVLEHADKILEIKLLDYGQLVNECKDAVTSYGGSIGDIPTQHQKLNACKYMAVRDGGGNVDNDAIIAFYQTVEGGSLSFSDAISQHYRYEGVHLEKVTNCYSSRAKDTYAFGLVFSYLTDADAEDFISKTAQLISMYSNFSIIGTEYGSNIPGIMDWINSTSSFSGSGLSQQGYNLKRNDLNALKTSLSEWIVDGVKSF